MGTLLWLVGAILGGYLFLMLFKWPLRRLIPDGPLLTIVASIIVFAGSGLAEGYGMADGGAPNFVDAYSQRLIPTVIVAVLDIVHFYLGKRKTGTSRF
jgi:hypothetical protein